MTETTIKKIQMGPHQALLVYPDGSVWAKQYDEFGAGAGRLRLGWFARWRLRAVIRAAA